MIKSPSLAHNAQHPWKRSFLGLGVALLLGGYWALFFTTRLPSLESRLPPEAQPAVIRRIDLVVQILLLPDEWLGEAWFGRPIQFGLGDRGPVLFWAGMLLTTAWAAGRLVLRWLGGWEGGSQAEIHCFSLAVGANLVSTYTLAVGLLGLLSYKAVFWIPTLALIGFVGHTGRKYVKSLFYSNYLESSKQSFFSKLTKPTKSPDFPNSASKPAHHPESQKSADLEVGSESGGNLSAGWFWAIFPFAGIILLGAMLPPVDFDVREYHLQAPKEWYLEGRVRFLPHNVYANMPLGAEMLPLAAMGMSGQWWVGALAGKTAMAGLTLVCAGALWCIGRRMFSPQAGAIAALVYLATPWIVQVSTAGLNEGVTGCYVLLGFWALWLWSTQSPKPMPIPQAGLHPQADRADLAGPNVPGSPSMAASCPAHASRPKSVAAYLAVAGYLIGAAAGTKYPAVLFVGLPGLVWVGWVGVRQYRAQSLRVLGVFLLAGLLGGGFWYAKNALLAGNPVYPLFYSLLGGKNWDAEKEARWSRVHFPREFSLRRLGDDLSRAVWRSEWIGPLMLPLALLGFLPIQRRAGSQLPLRSTLQGSALQGRSGACPEKTTGISRQGCQPSGTAKEYAQFPWVLLGYIGFWMGVWWLTTHRIDRFWLPVLPMLALLAGKGACCSSARTWQWVRTGLLIFGLGIGFLMAAGVPAAGGYNRYFLPLETLRQDPQRVDAWHLWLNKHVQEGRVLLVGDAQPFDLEVPVLYATCFNDSPLEEILWEAADRIEIPKNPNPSWESEDMKTPSRMLSADRLPTYWTTREFAEAIGAGLTQRKVEYIFVHWGEIARYRSPGNYGFSPLVQPELFDSCVRWGILVPLPPLENHPGRCYRVRPEHTSHTTPTN